MRIAINHTNFQRWGGSERYLFALVERLLEDGHELHVFCTRRRDPLEHPRLHFHPVPRLRGVRSLRVLSFALASERLLRAAGPFDLIHGFSKTWFQDVYTDGSGLQSVYRARQLRHAGALRRALTPLSPYQKVVEWTERRRFTRGSFIKILTMSRMVMEQLQGAYGLGPDEVEVLYNGIDVGAYHPGLRAEHRAASRAELGISEAAHAVLFIGSDYERKNLRLLIEAAAALPGRGEGFAFLILGRDNHPERYRRLARERGVAERFHFLGLRPEVGPWLGAADALVLPTFYDVFGMVVLEAMAAGLAPVVCRTAGAAEIVTHGRDGLVLESPEDAAALARELLALAAPGRAQALGKAARERALDFAWPRHMERLYAIYEEVITRKRATA